MRRMLRMEIKIEKEATVAQFLHWPYLRGHK